MNSGATCPACEQPIPAGTKICPECGTAVASALSQDEARALRGESRHLHPLAPLVFVVAGVVVGFIAGLAYGPVVGIPAGLFAGGIGVWMVERGRRLR